MRCVLATEHGDALYKQRGQLIEPYFGHTKHNRGFTRFHRRGRSAARTEWRLIATTHNLRKLHQHFTAPNDPGGERRTRPPRHRGTAGALGALNPCDTFITRTRRIPSASRDRPHSPLRDSLA